MANPEHIALLRQGGVDAWNEWREKNPDIRPDIKGADFTRANLSWADLSEMDLSGINLRRAILEEANFLATKLIKADLRGAHLNRANLWHANLSGARLARADLRHASLFRANLTGANLKSAFLWRADLSEANLTRANLRGATLSEATLVKVNLHGANLQKADLQKTNLVEADLRNADLTGCYIYGLSAWKVKLDGAIQRNVVITDVIADEPVITVDNIEVAQFVYLLLHNPKIREVIDTIGEKAVLILGRFAPERKKVLDALREELRRRGYVPILFDFEKPNSQNVTATVLTLARLSKFIIADLTDPSSIPFELGRIVPDTKVPVQPLLLSGKREFSMFPDLQDDYHWVLPTHHYDTLEQLIDDLNDRVIGPAEHKVLELRGGAKAVP